MVRVRSATPAGLTVLVGGVSLVVVFGLRVIAPRIPGALVLVVGGLVASGSSISARTASRWSATCREGCRRSSSPTAQLPGRPRRARSRSPRWRWSSSGSRRPPVTPGRSRPGTAIASTSTRNRSPRAWRTSAPACSRGCRSRRACPRSSLNDHSGARTGLASLTSGVIVLLTLLVLAPLFSDLPKPVLAALIIEAVVMGMMDVPEMRRLARVRASTSGSRSRRSPATLLFGVLAGVMIGIGLSLVWLISVRLGPRCRCLGREPGTEVFRELDEHPGDEQFPGVVVLRLDGGLFFATSDALEDRVREVACRHRRHHRDRARLRGDRLHRLARFGEDARDPRAHRARGDRPCGSPG